MIELLNAGHVPNGFDSGEPEINDFLIRLARVHTEAGYSRTWVTADPATQQVQGFVSMAASSQPVRLASAGDTKALLGERLSSSPFNRVPVLLIAYRSLDSFFTDVLPSFAPSFYPRDDDWKRLADAYDAEAEKRGDPRRAIRGP